MAWIVRPWEDRDTGGAQRIQHAAYPEYRTSAPETNRVRGWQAAPQSSAPAVGAVRYVASHEERAERAESGESGECVGYAALWTVRPRKLRFDLMVHPDYRCRGVGSLLLSRLLADSTAHDPETIQARARDDHTEALAFLTHRGFVETQRMLGLELTVADFRFSEWASFFDRLARSGIAITTLERARLEDDAWLTNLHEMYCAAAADWPDPDPDLSGHTPVPLEEFQTRASEFARPEAFFIATDGHRYVGASSIFALGTAVVPEHRGRGIATALKAMGIRFAQQQGINRVTTCTANPAMRAANEMVGFLHFATEVRLVRYCNNSPIRYPFEMV
jgi:GNAT superfamily N-acetyltransferase